MGIAAEILRGTTSHLLGICPCCQKGEMINHKTFVSCSDYSCNFVISKVMANKKLTEKNIKDLIERGKTTKIKGFTSVKGNKFDAFLKINMVNKKVLFYFC